VQALVDYQNPLRQNLKRVEGSGAAYYVNRRTSAAISAAFKADTDSLDESTGTYAQTSFAYKTLGVQIKVTRKSQAIGRTYSDILAEEVEFKLQEFKDKEDNAILWGQVTTNSPISGIGAAVQFDGLNALCPSGQIIVVTTAVAGGDLTLALLDEAIDRVREASPDMIITSRAGARKINALLQAQQRFVDRIEVKGGFKLASYNDIPIYKSTNIPATLTFSGSDISALTGGTTTAIFLVDSRKVFAGELSKLSVVALDKVSSQFDLYDIVEDMTLVARDANAIVKIVGINVA